MKPSKPQNIPKEAIFPATIPPTETAIRVHGEGGARLTLDVSESDMGAFLMTLPLRGKPLIVTLREREND